jgi:hypothetical protein
MCTNQFSFFVFDLVLLVMPSSTMIFLVISSFVTITYGRTLINPDQLMPLIFSSVNPDGNSFLPPPTSQNRLIVIIEQIIRSVCLFFLKKLHFYQLDMFHQ